jgi:glyoxylase-like metal-dependent hydrolase (beta-lactamase superfamily II)
MSFVTTLLNGISDITESYQEVTQDILLLQFTIVNSCIVGDPNNKSGEWVIVDTALEGSYDFIINTVEERFGKGSKPKAIILTHGHFDHIGSVKKLIEYWNVPVYAHELEVPYLTGQKDYPQGDPTVGGGMVAEISSRFPHDSVNLGSHVKALPKDGSIPNMPGWRWVHTPGHTEGHIALFRDKDRIIMAADAFCTVRQESILSVLTQNEQISGPPKYLTTDWETAKKSVKLIEDLKPSLAILSHGLPMKGNELTRHLEMLVNNFDNIALPEQGRFVDR